jgi:hypothetical protein
MRPLGPGMGGAGPGVRGPGRPGMGPPREIDDPEMAQLNEADQDLDRQTHELAEQLRRAPDGEARDKLKQELTDVIVKHFQVRQERRELEIKRLELQLDRLRASLKKRMADRDAIVKQRIANLLGDDELGF